MPVNSKLCEFFKVTLQGRSIGDLTNAKALERRLNKTKLKAIGFDCKVSLHGLRSSYAMLAYETLDSDVLAVQALLGHSAMSSTMRYVEALNIESKALKIKGVLK
jgi:integrase